MKQITIKWGMISGLIMVGIPMITYLLIGGGPETYRVGELIGYATIVLSLLLIFIAINEVRKLQPEQRIGFGKGLAIGLLVSAMAGSLFGIYNWIYISFLEPEFLDQYYNYYIDQLRESKQAEAEIEQQILGFEQQRAMFSNPLFQFVVMFFTVFAIGVIVSIFCAGVQSKIKST